MSDSLPSSVPAPSASAKASTAAIPPFRGSLLYICNRIAHRDAVFAKLDEKYMQREDLVFAIEKRLDGAKTCCKENSMEGAQFHIKNAESV